MSAGNRKNRWVPENQYSNPPAESNRRFVYILALLIAGGLLIGLVLGGPKAANAAPDSVEQQFAQLYSTLDNLKSKVTFLQKDRDRSDRYAQCLKQENRYLKQVLAGEKNYYAQPVCKR